MHPGLVLILIVFAFSGGYLLAEYFNAPFVSDLEDELNNR